MTNSANRTSAGLALSIWALLAGMALLLAGNGLQSSLLSIAGAEAGFPDYVNGLVMAGYFVGFIGGSYATPFMIARAGHIRTFAALASLASASVLVHAAFTDAPIWFAMRFATGFAFAGFYVVSESWLNAESDNTVRGGLLAIYMIVSYAGLALGQFALNLAPPESAALFLLCSITISLAAIPILLSAAPQPNYDVPSERLSIRKLLSITPTGAAGCAAAGAANGVVLGMGALYARRSGLDISETAFFMTAVMLGGALLQWPIGRLSDFTDRRRVILGVAVAAALSAAPLHLVSGGVPLYLCALLTGGLVLTLYPLALAYSNDWLTPQQMISGSSGLIFIYGVGAVCGPVLAGSLMSLAGAAGFPIALAVIHAAIAVYVAWRMVVRDAAPDQEDFLLAPAQTFGSGELYAEEAASDGEPETAAS